MKVAIFQPTYLSWLGFYKAIQWSDKFVFLDDVQFENHSWQSRNRIKSASGELLLSVPVVRHWPQMIKDVKINYAQDWVAKHLKSIQTCYQRAPFFNDFWPVLEQCYVARPEKLIELNIGIIRAICDYLAIQGDFIYSSELGVAELCRNKKIIAILRRLGAQYYLYTIGAADYMRPEIPTYEQAGLKLVALDFPYPVYPQLFGGFSSHLSIIDVIFNCGRQGAMDLLAAIDLK